MGNPEQNTDLKLLSELVEAARGDDGEKFIKTEMLVVGYLGEQEGGGVLGAAGRALNRFNDRAYRFVARRKGIPMSELDKDVADGRDLARSERLRGR